MHRSPYRTLAEPDEWRDEGDHRHADGELLPIFAIVWLLSALRVAGALHFGETMGAEPTVAMIVVVLLPSMVWRPIVGLLRETTDRCSRSSAEQPRRHRCPGR